MSTDPRNEIFDLKLKVWKVPPGGSSDPEHTPNFLEPGDNAVRLSRDYDLPPGTLRVTNAGSNNPDDQRVYERTSVPIYDEAFDQPNPDDPDLAPDERVEALGLLQVWQNKEKAEARFKRRYPDFYANFDRERGSPDDPDGAAHLRNPRLAPNATGGNLLWSFVFSNEEQPDVPTGAAGPNPWLTIHAPERVLGSNPEDPEFVAPLTIYEQSDSLRFKIMKCLTVAIYQARASWRITGQLDDDGMLEAPYVLERPFSEMDIYRGFQTFPDETSGTHIVNIEERPYLELEERVHIEQLLSESAADQLFETLISGWVPKTMTGQADNANANTDRVYPFLEAVRGRLGGCALDESRRDRVFRLAEKNNTVMRISPGGGTVNADQNNIPGFFLRLTMFLVEDLADSTYGE